ncbi:MAG TPA: RNA polymerase factor sigma-54 [Ktedonobacteraceae bacterium]|jgi:RNA polymerase sigma-54 factor
MRLEPTPKPDHTLRVSARLVTSSAILHLSADELEHAVTQEQIENPALEVREQRICLFCGAVMQGTQCASCGSFAQVSETSFSSSEQGDDTWGEASWPQWSEYRPYDSDNYGWLEHDEDEEADPLARIPMEQTLAETLLQQLEALVSPQDASIAEQLVGNLNERGYLEISTQEIATHLEVPLQRVEHVLSQLQTLEPSGIGARNLRECLALQLQAISESGKTPELAATLIDRYLDRLGKSQFQDIARELKVSEQDVREAAQYIRSTLTPHPAHSYTADTTANRPGTAYVRPDVLIRRGENSYEVELIEEKRYHFRIGPGYHTQPLHLTAEPIGAEMRRYLHLHADRARFFIDCIHRRWRTLKRVAELVVDYQREFLEKGVRYLRPLTRAEVAMRLNLDEGTVSRTTANKYALLPNGRLIPLADFFDGSLGVKDILRELIASEEPRHRFSDDELARLLNARGIPMARRTVTKYREEMGILSSRER